MSARPQDHPTHGNPSGKPKLTVWQRRTIRHFRERWGCALKELAHAFNVSESTISRVCKEKR